MGKITFQSEGHRKKGLLRSLPEIMVLSMLVLIFSLPQVFAAEATLTSLPNMDITNPNVRNQVIVNGKVTDKSGASLHGVSVVIQGTTTGTTTDFNGSYSITAKTGQTLIFSFILLATKQSMSQ